jgi:hypothetical protein
VQATQRKRLTVLFVCFLLIDFSFLTLSLQGATGLNLFRHCGSVRLSCYLTSAQPGGQIWIIGMRRAYNILLK